MGKHWDVSFIRRPPQVVRTEPNGLPKIDRKKTLAYIAFEIWWQVCLESLPVIDIESETGEAKPSPTSSFYLVDNNCAKRASYCFNLEHVTECAEIACAYTVDVISVNNC